MLLCHSSRTMYPRIRILSRSRVLLFITNIDVLVRSTDIQRASGLTILL